MMEGNKYEAIFFILNKGHIDEAMSAAREAGATGGTTLTGRGTATAEEAVKKFGVVFWQEKEIVLIIAEKEKRTGIMSAISKVAGLNKPGCGIGFSLPVEDVIGIGGTDIEET